ncbi:MAG: 16S rRNA (cytidine(1402)-2'-O)-methyltransferase [Oscillospiraceae bacterium]|jgi:16S rRNA (cytidine1402-2'-O)-methyltransferase|nr:16S rRNA (cytidine(1402)-2'-O)-methyltransferase [Oscillospiraceae bacterium]
MLYIVGTPIGNPGDLSPRAKEVLESVEFIACEDTRETGLLLKAFGIRTKLFSYHEHNRVSREAMIMENLKDGKKIALVSDAGMPCISDPGEQLVRRCASENIPVTTVPGPTALASALALSGMDTRRFIFEGFIPSEGKERKERLSAVNASKLTTVMYEAPHRLIKTLDEMKMLGMGTRMIVFCRELTKKYEQVVRLSVDEALEYYVRQAPKGEFVLVVEGATEVSEAFTDSDLDEKILALAKDGYTTKEIAALLSAETGKAKNIIYSKALMVLKYRKEQPE